MRRQYKTVRIGAQVHDTLKRLAKEDGGSLQDVLGKAIKEYDRQRFFDRLDADFVALRADPLAWKEYRDELKLWEGTLMDGLDPDENRDPATRVPRKRPVRKRTRSAR